MRKAQTAFSSPITSPLIEDCRKSYKLGNARPDTLPTLEQIVELNTRLRILSGVLKGCYAKANVPAKRRKIPRDLESALAAVDALPFVYECMDSLSENLRDQHNFIDIPGEGYFSAFCELWEAIVGGMSAYDRAVRHLLKLPPPSKVDL